jgi:hypothetical protein
VERFAGATLVVPDFDLFAPCELQVLRVLRLADFYRFVDQLLRRREVSSV